VATKVIVKHPTGRPGLRIIKKKTRARRIAQKKQKAGRLGPALRIEKLSIAELS
jgi:hypothetical protein